MENEIWKPVPDYEGIYEVSNLGNVRSLDRIVSFIRNGQIINKKAKGRNIKKQKDKNGYLMFSMLTNKNTKKIHQLVGLCFVPNPENKPFINHKNGIKSDNRAENLEWSTAKENTQHAHRMNLVNVPKGVNHYSSKPIINIETGEIFACIREASENSGINESTLYHYLNGNIKNKSNLFYAKTNQTIFNPTTSIRATPKDI